MTNATSCCARRASEYPHARVAEIPELAPVLVDVTVPGAAHRSYRCRLCGQAWEEFRIPRAEPPDDFRVVKVGWASSELPRRPESAAAAPRRARRLPTTAPRVERARPARLPRPRRLSLLRALAAAAVSTRKGLGRPRGSWAASSSRSPSRPSFSFLRPRDRPAGDERRGSRRPRGRARPTGSSSSRRRAGWEIRRAALAHRREIVAGEVRTLHAHFVPPARARPCSVAEALRGERAGLRLRSRASTDYFRGGSHGHVGILAVAGEAEGRGAGRALLEAAEGWREGARIRVRDAQRVRTQPARPRGLRARRIRGGDAAILEGPVTEPGRPRPRSQRVRVPRHADAIAIVIVRVAAAAMMVIHGIYRDPVAGGVSALRRVPSENHLPLGVARSRGASRSSRSSAG